LEACSIGLVKGPKSLFLVLTGDIKADSEGILGLISYKVGMGTAVVKDNTDKSLTKGKRKAIPVTVLEVPKMKIFCVRFYKNGQVAKDVIVSNDKELKKVLKVPKNVSGDLDKVDGWDDIRIIVYSVPGFKKVPDLAELGINAENKLAFVKSLIGREISPEDIMKWKLVDVRGLTKGKGLQGPVRRFGITLKVAKSEKGRRKPGSLGPWKPSRVTFRVPMAGQLGMFTRVHYNNKVIDFGNVKEKDVNKKEGFKRYGKIKGNYIIVAGSVQGPSKRQILITPAMRPNKKQSKKDYELLEVKF